MVGLAMGEAGMSTANLRLYPNAFIDIFIVIPACLQQHSRIFDLSQSVERFTLDGTALDNGAMQ
jgi:hypothetical protein